MKTFLFTMVMFMSQPLFAQRILEWNSEPTPEQQKWAVCGEIEMQKYEAQGVDKAEIDFCKYIEAEVGKDCDEAVVFQIHLGIFKEEVEHFILDTVLVPVCGEVPE